MSYIMRRTRCSSARPECSAEGARVAGLVVHLCGNVKALVLCIGEFGAWLSPVRALGLGPRGRGFESLRPDFKMKS